MAEQEVREDGPWTVMAADRRHAAWSWAWLLLALSPALLAVAWFPRFVTQDGPAHAASAQILVETLQDTPTARSALYEVRLSPLPNWAGHAMLGGLIAAGLSPRDADRLVMVFTLVFLAAAILGLRLQVAGSRSGRTWAWLAGLLAMNLMWLFGFYSFLIGAGLYALTLGLWWRDRDRPGLASSLLIASLLVAGYFAHLVSLGLTAFGLAVLAIATPGPPALKRQRIVWTAASLLPLIPLAIIYLRLMRQGGGLKPTWPILQDPTSLGCWWRQLGWVDPISLGSKLAAPFATSFAPRYFLFSPTLWLVLGLGGCLMASWRARSSEPSLLRQRRGFFLIAAVLLLVGLLGPDSLGATHGNYLAQREVLLGLIALIPLLEMGQHRSRLSRLGGFALLVAAGLQAAFVVDYASRSERVVGNLLAAQPFLGQGQRVGMVALELRQPFRANPLRHADCLLGLENGNVIWGNYEMAHYYFPIQIRREIPHPPVLAFEEISLMDDPAQAADRARAWESLLKNHHPEIDRIVLWGEGRRERQMARRWYEWIGGIGKASVYGKRPHNGSPRLANQGTTTRTVPAAR